MNKRRYKAAMTQDELIDATESGWRQKIENGYMTGRDSLEAARRGFPAYAKELKAYRDWVNPILAANPDIYDPLHPEENYPVEEWVKAADEFLGQFDALYDECLELAEGGQ